MHDLEGLFCKTGKSRIKLKSQMGKKQQQAESGGRTGLLTLGSWPGSVERGRLGWGTGPAAWRCWAGEAAGCLPWASAQVGEEAAGPTGKAAWLAHARR